MTHTARARAAQSWPPSAFARSYFDRPGDPAPRLSPRGQRDRRRDWAHDRLVPDMIRGVFSGLRTCRSGVRNRYRPWQHVLEPLSGYLLLAEKLHSGRQACRRVGRVNFGPPQSAVQTVRVVADTISGLWGSPYRWIDASDPNAVHEATLLQLDSTKAQVASLAAPLGFPSGARRDGGMVSMAARGSRPPHCVKADRSVLRQALTSSSRPTDTHHAETAQSLRAEILALVQRYKQRHRLRAEAFRGWRDGGAAGRESDRRPGAQAYGRVVCRLTVGSPQGASMRSSRSASPLSSDASTRSPTNSGSSANLLAMTALTSPKLRDRQVKPPATR